MQKEIVFELTTVDDLLAIARSLLADKTLRPIFERIGVHGEMSEDEEKAVSELIENFSKEAGWKTRDPRLLPLAITTARWAAAGKFALDSDEAREFVQDRHFVRPSSKDVVKKKIPAIEETLMLARDRAMNDEVMRLLRKGYENRKGPYEMWDNSDEETEWINDQRFRSIRKLGLVNRDNMAGDSAVIVGLVKGELNSVDDPKVKEILRRKNIGF